MIYIVVSVLAGVCITMNRLINTSLAGKIGIFQSTLFNYIVGLIVSTACLFFSKEGFHITGDKLVKVPLWAFGGGILGVIVIALSSYITPKISAFYFTIIMFIGQLFTGILIDFISLDLLSVGKVAGGLLVLLGLIYNQYIDRSKIKQTP